MAESDFEKDRLNGLNCMLPDTDDLPVHLLAGIFRDKNQSYKLFWFQAILDAVCEGEVVISYEQLIHRMVAESWYMVMEYHLNLGPADAMEILINQVRDTSGLLPAAKKEEIIRFLKTSNDENVKKAKQKLVLNVPYRLQAPFLGKLSEKEWRDFRYIETKAIYLQRRNPNVPGIPFKIRPPEKRDLKSAMNFWSVIIEHHQLKDIYTGKTLNSENFNELGKMHIDHFVPWSYLASDEIWNLTPTFAKINISKSNQLPNRSKDIALLSKQHYDAFRIVQSNKEIGKLFQKYKRKNLNNPDLEGRLYSREISEEEFSKNMDTLIQPICQSAKNQGFMEWENRKIKPQRSATPASNACLKEV